MYRFLLFFSLLVLCSFFQARGQLKEEIVLEKDTVWIVNKDYDEYHQSLNLQIDFKNSLIKPVKADWGDGSPVVSVGAQTSLTHTYKQRGLYTLKLTDANGYPYYYRIFNKRLTVDFTIVPKPFQYCFEQGGDSLLIIRSGIDQNMPETEYDIVVTGPDPIEEGVSNLCQDQAEWFGPRLDSAWVIFNQQTGVKPCEVEIRMTYEDKDKNIKLEEKTDPQRLSIYRAPNVRKIIDFSEPEKGGTVENFKECATTVWRTISDDILNYYQYKPGGNTPVPYYDDYEHRKDFDVRYWYSDTVYKDMPESRWREVTGMKDTVSTSKDISFFVSGYYKMMITAKNMCNDVAGIKYDTLWTHRISWDEADTLRRYFQIYAGDSTKLVCKDTLVCLNLQKEIVFVDYNVRRGYEAPPVYHVTLMNPELLHLVGEDTENVQPNYREEIWRGGKRIDDASVQQICGCDSTVIRVTFNHYNFYGELNLQISKNGRCNSNSSTTFKIKAGDAPGHKNLKTALLQDLHTYGVSDEGERCDTFRYKMPLEGLLLKEAYVWGVELDSVRFALKQGNADEKIVYYRRGGTKDLTFLFDSTEVDSRIVYRSYNRCGTNDDTLSFRVYAKPNVELWRDSVAGNDSLCVDMGYPYYWEGKFPPQYEMLLLPQGDDAKRVPVTINGVESSKGQVAFENGDTIRYTETGDITEEIVIYNTNQPSCNATLVLDLTVLNQPDVPRFKDSIGICEGLGTLDTRKLFAAGKSDFNRAEWQLNDGAADKEKFPVFTLSENREDTLHYTLLQSKGCYRKGDLPVRPQKAPELVLKPDYRYCLPDSIKELREEGFVEKISEWAGCNSLKVFKDVVGSEPLYNEGIWGVSKLTKPYIPENGRKLIYEMTNIRVDTAFMGKCRVTDTVALQVSAPKLQVLKDDTLKYPWTRYEFSRMRGHIDTAALDKASLKWTLQPDGKPAGTGLFEPVYDLTETEKSRDTLLFELSALNYCGDEWKDTLYVRLNHLKLKAYKDTICSNTEGYPLWDKVDASFADPSTVTWKIVYPEESRGTLSATTGINATYTPEGLETGDSVRIALEAALVDAAGVKNYDTVVLKINKAPIFKFVKDTLWVCNNEIKIAHLQGDQKGVMVVKENIGKRADGVDWISRGDFVNEGKGQFGQWANGGDYNFPSDHMLGQEENVTQKVSYRAHGLKGCADVLDSVVLLNPVRATLTFKRPAEEMCAGDLIKLDTLYTLKGEDRFTQVSWELGNTAAGRIENGHYHASKPQDEIQELIASTYKEYTCYTGLSSGQVLKTPIPVRLPLTVHREPEFSVVDKFDTLCYNNAKVEISREAVKVAEGLYPDYRDSVLVNGKRLKNDGLEFEHTQPGTLEKYVVTVLQGRCTNWKDKSDTIYVYRLPQMITGSIPEMSVCEGSSVEVNESQLTFNRLASKPDWSKTTGGVLSQGDDGKMIFTPATGLDDEGATVTVTVNPPHGCPEESMTGVVKVGRKPRLSNHAYVFCQVAGHTATVSGELASNAGVVLDAIKWYRIAVDDEEITTGVKSNWDLELQITEADLSKSPLLLRAEMRCSGACSGVFNDTVSITWQEAPVITVESGLAVCQASLDGLALGQKVSVTHGNGTTWSLVTTDKGTWDNDALTFKPGDVSGTASVQVTVAGLATCPSETKTVNMEVLAAPASGISIAGERCSTRELAMKPANEQADNGYEWSFGDGNTASEKSVKKSYAQTGTYTVTMTGKFQNGCTRVEKEEVTVNLRPTAAFTMQDPAPVKTLIEITSTSTPENVTCNWRIDGSTTYSDKNPASHRFDSEGTHTVMLEVVTPEGCKDTLTKKPTVLSEPVAKFEIKVDSCTGEVQITNRSELHGAAIAWDFGNGSSVSDAETPGKQLYQPIYRDTTYTITLTLTNVSGSSKASRSFVVKSLLEPKFDFLSLDPCSKVAKKLEVQTRGDADTTYLDWGDGTKEYWTKENAGWLWEHVYASNDTKADKRYTVTMRPVNACYKNLSVSKELTVAPSGREVALRDSCYNKNGCYGDYWEFRKHSFGFLKDGYMCTWDFGDGARLSNPADTVKHVYEHPGTYIVVATVEDRCESVEVRDTIKVVGNDSLDFEFSKPVACIGDTVEVRFVQRGKEIFTGLVWTLPGNLFETVRNSDTVKYICRQEGKRQIELSAVASGCPSEKTFKTLRIAKTPDVQIDRGRPKQDSIQCVPFSLKLWAVDWNKCQTTVRWDFGNGDLSNLQNPETIYREPGKYTVRLVMTTPEGCTDTDTLPIVALKTPVPVVELKDSLVCSTSGTFILTAYNRTEAIEENTYRWMRGSQSVVLSHYPDTVNIPFMDFWGKEDILLCATDTGTLCSDTARVAFVMSEPVKARVEVIPDTVCAGMDVVFRDTTPAGAARTFFFEDGDTNEAGEFERFYGEPGKYPYVVAVENQQGCRDTLRDTVVVYTLPVADFIPVKDNTILEEGLEHVSTDIENGGMRFTNHSRIHPFEWEKNRLSYEWDFGDGHFSQEENPVHSYDNNGNFEVWLRVISAMGCCDSISDMVNIGAIKGLYFPNAMAPASSDPGVNRFQPKGVGLHSFLVRIFTPNGGTCVWQSDKLDAGKPAEYWDGTFNGQPVSAGLYIWEASATFIDGSFTGHLNGVVNVIR